MIIKTDKNPHGVFDGITAAVDGLLDDKEIKALMRAKAKLTKAARRKAKPEQFIFFAAFDGTNNDKDHLEVSGTRQMTNVGMLYDMADTTVNQKPVYFAGVGTGGDMCGGFSAASTTPTPNIVRTAKWAYEQFVTLAGQWLREGKGRSADDVLAAITGFSRGAGTAILFAKMLNDGLMPNGTPIAPGAADRSSVPKGVPVVATLLFDPVFTGICLDLRLPDNIQNNVVVLKAEDEFRDAFRAADFGDDPRMTTIHFRGNHGNIGGFYDNGIGALVLEGAAVFFKKSGIAMRKLAGEREVPTGREFVNQNVFIYNECWDRKYNNPKKWTECKHGGKRMTAPVNNAIYGKRRSSQAA